MLITSICDIPQHGLDAPAAGGHSVWAWAEGGKPVKIAIAGERLEAQPPTREKFIWLRLGDIDVAERARLTVEVDPQGGRVGYIALARGPFEPERYFATSRVFPGKPGPIEDERLERCRTLNDRMKPRSFASKKQWEACREQLKEHILVSTGLWPMPERTPLKARVFGTVKHDDYTVSKVHFESRPGFFVCGNLYRPVGKEGPFPGILCPHGHWGRGRFGRNNNGCVRSRMISFARQGYVAFSWSMVGYNDADQVRHSFHDEPWGFSLMGLQLWNSIRACDWLSSLDEVASDRIGCTGASGGGTQTFMLMAVDERIRVAAPVNMVSAIMQGGCECENAPLLRLEANNVEIASMMAPRPLLMVSATGDWTKNTLELEYPAVREVYKLYDAADRVEAVRIDAPHNYNLESRNAVYRFFARWLLKANDPESFEEKPLEVDQEAALRVFSEEHPRPGYALDAEGLREYLIEEATQRLDELRPKDKASLTEFRDVMGVAYRHAFSAAQPEADDVEVRQVGEELRRGRYALHRRVIGRKGTGERIPIIAFEPTEASRTSRAAVVLHPLGKAGLCDPATGEPVPLVTQLLAKGYRVIGVDCFLTGEMLSPFEQTRRPTAPKHDLTYNRTTLAHRVQDILTTIGGLDASGEVDLIGLKEAGLWCLAARPLARGVRRTVVDAARFNPANGYSRKVEMLVPGIRRIGGLDTAGGLTAPGELFIHNTGEHFKTQRIEQVYHTAGAGDHLRTDKRQATLEQTLDYLTR